MSLKYIFLFIILFQFKINSVKSWDSDDFEIFDLVEEIKENFYELLGIQKDANLQEIKRAFRNLSIVLHPDKNDHEDANIQFRNLVSVYEVLKDNGKREKYDKVLREGLPNWKSGIYYYRHFRKMGLMEMTIILFVIITIGQYFVAWAAYIEKKYTAEQLIGSKIKKIQKKGKSNLTMEDIMNNIPAPSIKNTLPFQIPRAIYSIPSSIKLLIGIYSDYRKEQLELKYLEDKKAEEMKLLEEELAKEKEAKANRKRKQVFIAPEKTEEELLKYSNRVQKVEIIQSTVKTPVSGGLWTDEDIAELSRLVQKYPAGTRDRWELIADTLFRNISEVTHMVHKLKETNFKRATQPESIADQIAAQKPKIKKSAEQILVPESTWSQEQQKALEAAIVKYPKSNSADRWQKISSSVPGKTKEECLLRYKYLVEVIKLQKQQQQDAIKQQQESEQIEVFGNKTDDDKLDEEKIVKSKNSKKVIETDNKVNGDNNIEPTSENVMKSGKKKNLRKERKKKMDFSSDEDENFLNDNDN